MKRKNINQRQLDTFQEYSALAHIFMTVLVHDMGWEPHEKCWHMICNSCDVCRYPSCVSLTLNPRKQPWRRPPMPEQCTTNISPDAALELPFSLGNYYEALQRKTVKLTFFCHMELRYNTNLPFWIHWCVTRFMRGLKNTAAGKVHIIARNWLIDQGLTLR